MNCPVRICPECGGSGCYDMYYNEYDIYEVACNHCDGTGEIEDV